MLKQIRNRDTTGPLLDCCTMDDHLRAQLINVSSELRGEVSCVKRRNELCAKVE